MDFSPLLQSLRKGWLLICVLALAGVGVAGGYLVTVPPHYEATARAFLPITQADQTEGTGFIQQVAQSYADVATSQYVLSQVVRELGLKETARHLADRVTAEALPGTTVIEISASDPSPTMAARIANDVYRRLAGSVRALTPDKSTPITLKRTEAALPPAAPTMQNLLPTLLLGLLVGAAVGVVAAALRGPGGGGSGGIRLTSTLQTT